MAFEIPGFSYTLEASGDLSGAQFAGLIVDGSGQAAVAGAGVQIIGVSQEKPEVAGEATQIVQSGITKMKAGGVVAIAAKVATDATGRAVASATTDFPVGIALEASANADEIITVLLTPGGGQLN